MEELDGGIGLGTLRTEAAEGATGIAEAVSKIELGSLNGNFSSSNSTCLLIMTFPEAVRHL